MFLLVSVLLTVLLSAAIPTYHQHCGDVNADTLVLTVVIFRHGDRTPYKTYPTDPYQADFWKPWGGFGQLTQTGMEQHFLFGQWIRNCYGSFLNNTYNPKDLRVRSTDYDRTLQSVEAHLAGAYPPYDFQIWTSEEVAKLWQPIPIHTIPQSDDYLLITEIACPPYDALIADVWANSPRIKEIQTKNQALLDYMAKMGGLDVPGDLDDVSSNMCDAVKVERIHNLTLPEWMNSTVVEKLDLWKDIWIIVKLANDEMVRYAAGELVHHLRELLVNKTKGIVSNKHIIYSAHDTTVGTLLAAYGDFDRIGPPYRSSVITELHFDKTESRYFVKAFYRNNTEADPYPLQIRNCGNKRTLARCYLEDYVKVLEPVSLPNKKEVCWGPQKNDGLDQNTIIAVSVTSGLVVILVVTTVVYLLLPVCSKRKEPTEPMYQ